MGGWMDGWTNRQTDQPKKNSFTVQPHTKEN